MLGVQFLADMSCRMGGLGWCCMRAYNANAAQKPRNQRTLPFHILISCILDLYIYIYYAAHFWRRWGKIAKNRVNTTSRRTRGETLRLDMQLKRFALFRDDVRDLVTLTVDRALDAVLTQSHRICGNHWTVSTMLTTSRLPCAKLVLCPLCPVQEWMYTI